MARIQFLLIFTLLAGMAPAEEWRVWEGFGALLWQPEAWPMTKTSEIVWDASRSVSGKTSLRTTIESSGWGGALKAANHPIVPAPKKDMSVQIYCEALPDAEGVPMAKLEVYAQKEKQTLGGPDTPLRLGKWTTVRLPASVFDKTAEGMGIVFLRGESSGKFRVWMDRMERDGEVWEDFEYAGTSFWRPVNITGEYECLTLSPGLEEPPGLEEGRAIRLHWKEDRDGVELKTNLASPFDISGWKSVRIRAWVPEGGRKIRVSLWLFDGEKGTFSSGSFAKADGKWGHIVHDLTAQHSAVDSSRIKEISIVLHDYEGDSGEVVLDRLEFAE
jgi:hypothetical protein